MKITSLDHPIKNSTVELGDLQQFEFFQLPDSSLEIVYQKLTYRLANGIPKYQTRSVKTGTIFIYDADIPVHRLDCELIVKRRTQ